MEKNLVGTSIVIVDSLNYIKGYRYQMHCVAREQKTTYCLIYCNTPLEIAQDFNKKNENRFTEEMVEDYSKRMEPPQLKSILVSIKIAGMFRFSRGEMKSKPHLRISLRCCFSRPKSLRIQCQQSKRKSYQKTICIVSTRYALKSASKPVWAV